MEKSTSWLKFIFVSSLTFSFALTVGQDSSSGYLVSGNDSIFYETSGSGKVIILIRDGMFVPKFKCHAAIVYEY